MNNPSAKPALSVLVTRPAHQSAGFADLLQTSGFSTVCLPTIEIEYVEADLTETLQSALIIFTSVNSVTGANRCTPLPFQSKIKLAAIGNATKRKLESLKSTVEITPRTGSGSEALLQAIEDVLGDVTNLKVTIVRGDRGREALYAGLKERGAQVRYESVYVRKTPVYTKQELQRLTDNGLPDLVSVTSDLGLTNLLTIIPEDLKPALLTRPLVVNSQRCQEIARREGFSAKILIADPPGDKAQLEAICKLAQLPEDH